MDHGRSTILALLVSMTAVACAAPDGGLAPEDLAGSWSRDPHVVATFSGSEAEGTFSYVVPTGASGLPAGCRDTFHFTGTYTVDASVLTSSATAVEVSRTHCEEPENDVLPISMPAALDGFGGTLSGAILVTDEELTIAGADGPAMFARSAGSGSAI